MRSADTSNKPITPALIEAPLKAPKADAEPTASPHVGELADSSPPDMALSASAVEKLIEERVNEAVTAKLKALELDDPSKEDFTQEDQQFKNFDKKLEVFGVDFNDVLPGFVPRWFNDDGDRIPRMQIMGWEFVKRTELGLNEKLAPLNQDLGDNIAVYVGSKEAGGPMRAFLMKLPKDLYERRYNRAQEHNDMIEDMIKHGAVGDALAQGGYPGTDGGGVKIAYNPRQARLMGRPKPT